MKLILTCIVSFLVTAAVGKKLIPVLRRLKAGQSILEDGPTWHASKQGTPTMGGIMFIAGILAAILIVGWQDMTAGDLTHLYVFGFAAIFGLIGFLDDYQKVKKKQNLGLTALQKFLLQLAAAVAFLCLMRAEGMLMPSLYVPFFNTRLILSWPIYLVFAAFVIVGTVNAVNITDGVDGLAASVTVPVALFFAVLSVWWQGFSQLGVYAAALVGGLLGFLVYNFHPAKVFLGDTGSLFLGGTVAALAFAYDMPLILVIVGIVYICETMSDIIQVAYFKATHGKRFFKMAPLHHHFELCGWSEVKLVTIFTLVSAVCCVLALIGVIGRYGF
ncbi:MAG: phospho-N-acetylmuramoyl-pentapeptide-transferase [Oscillospiraceae bacterium]|nr:phospho-N-acetylmuramoyl-pentapeptide-transferase [Oscillospiraceae bacterium]